MPSPNMYAQIDDDVPPVPAYEVDTSPTGQVPNYERDNNDFCVSIVVLLVVCVIPFPPIWLYNLKFWNSSDGRARIVSRISLVLAIIGIPAFIMVLGRLVGRGGHHRDPHHDDPDHPHHH
ncbi:hypothetical protein P9112_009313 [Eukaryota sp. TZLM1-RC]